MIRMMKTPQFTDKESRYYSSPVGLSAVILILIMFLASIGAILRWQSINQAPFGHDSLAHMTATIQLSHAIEQDEANLLDLFTKYAARYMPLFYLVGASMKNLSSNSYWGYAATPLLFWVLSGIFLILGGLKGTEYRSRGMIPFLVFLSVPAGWDAAVSYNLESSLVSGILFILIIFLTADSLTLRLNTGLACLAVILFSMTKLVLLLPTLPAAIVLTTTGEPETKRKRSVMLATLIAANGLWIGIHYQGIVPELLTDFRNVASEEFSGLSYYPLLLAVGYRGLPLFIGLACILLKLKKEGKLGKEDLAFALFFMVPLIFFSIVDTKRPWYMLGPFFALPLWYLSAAERLKAIGWIRRLSQGLTVFYMATAATMIVSIGTVKNSEEPLQMSVLAYRLPFVPPPLEKEMVRIIIDDLVQEPRSRIAVDLTATQIPSDFLSIQLILKRPELAVSEQYAVADATLPRNDFFVQSLPQSTRFYTVGAEWPKIQCGDFGLDCQIDFFQNYIDRIQEAENTFIKEKSVTISSGQMITVFVNKEIEKTLLPESESSQRLKRDGIRMKEEGRQAFERDDDRQAIVLLQTAAKLNPDDPETTFLLAKSLTKAGDGKKAFDLWELLFQKDFGFGIQIEALNFIADMEKGQKVQAGTFRRYLNPLIDRYEQYPKLMYALLSVRIRAEQNKKDWKAALEAITRLRKYLEPEQVPGVNLSEALILLEMDQLDLAESLLRSNVMSLQPNNIGYADSALHLARLLADRKNFSKAIEWIEKSRPGSPDPNFFSGTVIYVAKKQVEAGRKIESIRLLEKTSESLKGDPAGLILIEIGNIYREMGDLPNAKAAYEKARKEATGKEVQGWLEETVSEL